ncbi:hypothetical protein AVEN_171439-1 [Araneus ventricosus]|uniref:PiggyBac transposable element-derived protein domain-containing protein n=1 Tax=Araneus ventricosus TaxID=182803 RepID=A0A4Y2D4D2_ARAVE|nr:hypothetical protein AVEN_171439-1 [Araneus ventricosus]
MHNDDTIDEEKGDAKKTELISFYYCKKGAVDVVDDMAAHYSTARKKNRWPFVTFYSIRNVAAINAGIVLLSHKNPPNVYRSRRRSIKDIAFSLISDYANKRMNNPSLTHELRVEIEKIVALTLRNYQ